MIELVSRVETLENQLERAIQAVEHIDHHIRGNGSPGVIYRLGILEERLAAREKADERRWRVLLSVLSTLAGAVLLQLLGIK